MHDALHRLVGQVGLLHCLRRQRLWGGGGAVGKLESFVLGMNC